MRKKCRKILLIASAMLLILLSCPGCQSNQEEIFSESSEALSQPSDEENSETVILLSGTL